MENMASNDRTAQEDLSPIQPGGEIEPSDAGSDAANGDPVHTEAEVLRRELALFQAELDAIQDRVVAIQRESSSLADTVRRQGEEQAREIVARAEREGEEIVQRAMAQAELVELRAKVRAEETRARAVARLWSRLEASRGGVVGGRQVSVDDGESIHAAEASSTELKESADSAEIDREAGSIESVPGWGAENGGASFAGEPVEQRFRTSEPLSFASMMALEETVRSFPCVTAASVEPTSGGAVMLKVTSTDPNNTSRLLASTRGLPALQETP